MENMGDIIISTAGSSYSMFACILTEIAEQSKNAFIASAAKKLQNELADLVDPLLNRCLSQNDMITCVREGAVQLLKD